MNVDLETKVKLRTKELFASEERFRLLSKATNDAVWDLDLTTNTVWFNDSFATTFGNKIKDIRGNWINTWLSGINKADRERVNKSLNTAIAEGASKWSEEYLFKKANGEEAHIYDRGYILRDETGKPLRILSTMLDVTRLKEAEREVMESGEKLRFLADSIPQLLLTTDNSGKIDYMNSKWLQYINLDSVERARAGLKNYIHPDDYALFVKYIQGNDNKAAHHECEVRIKDGNGNYNWFLSRSEPRFDESGNVTMWVNTCTNIHEQKSAKDSLEVKIKERSAEIMETNAKLEKINEELEKTNYDLLQFASVASHDIKEPLRKIITYSSLLHNRYAPELNDNARKYVSNIVHTSDRMMKLIDDLLIFSRLSHNSLEYEQVDLNDVIDGIKKDLEIVIKEKNATITHPKLPYVFAVNGQIRQLFQNLISNSLKFSKPETPPVVNITGTEIIKKNKRKYIKIVLQDNGIGFKQEYADKIFVIFQRLHSKAEYDGTGIGLAIVKKIVEMHQGDIIAYGKPGEGSVFEVHLPIGAES